MPEVVNDPLPKIEQDPLLGGMVVALILASAATWIFLLAKKQRDGSFLRYEPRTPVPWGWPAGMLAIVFTLLAMIGGLAMRDQEPAAEPAEAFQRIQQLFSMIFVQIVIVGGFFALVVALSGARIRDLGLPVFAHEVVRDIKIGAVACLTALAPVYLTQAILVQFLDEPSQHPLVDMVVKRPDVIVMALAFVVAVIIAPISEEITYRLLLQGWLETWEERLVGWREPILPAETLTEIDPAGSPRWPDLNAGVERGRFEERLPEMTALERTAADEELPGPGTPLMPLTDEEPPRFGTGGLPYGSVPIVISATLFSLAHFSHGTDPIPLLPLAIILGYTYHRTHRIIPCIVTHMLFNGVAMAALGRIIYLNS